MDTSIILFVIGVITLLVSTHVFVKSAERISNALQLSPLVIGLTVVSIGTSLPELTVSIIAAVRGDIGLALGNIIGSNIINVYLVLGIGILVGKLRVGTTKTQRNIYMMFGVTGVFLLLYVLGLPAVIAGGMLLMLAVMITIKEYAWGIAGRKHEDAMLYPKKRYKRFSSYDTFIFIGSMLGVISGGILTVSSVEQLAARLGFSTTILGLSITAIATSMPELLTTIFSQKDKESKITIGNLIGSNMYNLTLIGGVILLVSSGKIITLYEFVMLIIATGVFVAVVMVYKGKVIPKYVGITLLTLFSVYIYFLK